MMPRFRRIFVLSAILSIQLQYGIDCSARDISCQTIQTEGGGSRALRLLTINVWSGLDYEGFFSFGEYESDERREARFQALVREIEGLDPDVIFIQEATPLPRYASRLARRLSYDEIHQVVNGGIKFGPLGIPVNFKEGLVILARPSLRLGKFDAWKLSGGFGLHGDAVTIHFDESIFSLVGKVYLDDVPIYLVNVHLVSSPPEDQKFERELDGYLAEGSISESEHEKAVAFWRDQYIRRREEVEDLLERLGELPTQSPVIVGGDFNATPDSPEMQVFSASGRYFDTRMQTGLIPQPSWDPEGNENISFSAGSTDARGRTRTGYSRLFASYAAQSRRIDYIFLSSHFNVSDVIQSDMTLNSSLEGITASDHYGILVDLNMEDVLDESPREPQTLVPLERTTFEPLPILMYDTDIGFGYGAKTFLLNSMRRNESFDMMVFFSTGVDTLEGERRYRFVFSFPDFDRRQGKIYPFAVDFLLDYDIWINNSFFGTGNDSEFGDREYYSREPFEISLTLSRGFTPHTVGQIGTRFKTIRNSNFSSGSRLAQLGGLNSSRVTYASLFSTYRYDTRDIFTNPSRGVFVRGELEYVPDTGFSNVTFTRWAGEFQYYAELFYPTTILAARLGVQGLMGDNLPIQVLLPVGGSKTLRGFPQDRFLDRVSAVSNVELRFPLIWRFGGVAGLDAGKVWYSPGDIDFSGWAVNRVVGLRFYMQTFVVRVDIGFGPDAMGFYFNFGHVF